MSTRDSEWYRYQRKDGKPGRLMHRLGPEYTTLNACDVCGKLGIPRKVRVRNDVFGWNGESEKDWTTPSKDMLCTGCWNKVRAIVRKRDEANSCRRMLNKLTRTIRDERKNQNDRRSA